MGEVGCETGPAAEEEGDGGLGGGEGDRILGGRGRGGCVFLAGDVVNIGGFQVLVVSWGVGVAGGPGYREGMGGP